MGFKPRELDGHMFRDEMTVKILNVEFCLNTYGHHINLGYDQCLVPLCKNKRSVMTRSLLFMIPSTIKVNEYVNKIHPKIPVIPPVYLATFKKLSPIHCS